MMILIASILIPGIAYAVYAYYHGKAKEEARDQKIHSLVSGPPEELDAFVNNAIEKVRADRAAEEASEEAAEEEEEAAMELDEPRRAKRRTSKSQFEIQVLRDGTSGKWNRFSFLVFNAASAIKRAQQLKSGYQSAGTSIIAVRVVETRDGQEVGTVWSG